MDRLKQLLLQSRAQRKNQYWPLADVVGDAISLSLEHRTTLTSTFRDETSRLSQQTEKRDDTTLQSIVTKLAAEQQARYPALVGKPVRLQ